MRFGWLRPLHGWRAFVGEVGIVVLGVLLALGAEGVAARFADRQRADQTRAALKAQLADTALNAWERVAVAGCLRGRVRALIASLGAGGERWRASPMPLRTTPGYQPWGVPPAYSAPMRLNSTDAWRNTLSSGDFNHLTVDEVNGYSAAELVAGYSNELVEREAAAASRLAPLSFDRRLSSRDRADMIAALSEVDRAAIFLEINSKELLDAIRRLRLGYDRAAIERRRRAVLSDQRTYRGPCVQAVPLDLG